MLRAITVGELKEALDGFSDNAKVVMAVEYGDIGNTIQALGVNSIFHPSQEGWVLAKTAYSSSGYCLEEQSEVDEEDLESFNDQDENGDCFHDIVVLR